MTHPAVYNWFTCMSDYLNNQRAQQMNICQEEAVDWIRKQEPAHLQQTYPYCGPYAEVTTSTITTAAPWGRFYVYEPSKPSPPTPESMLRESTRLALRVLSTQDHAHYLITDFYEWAAKWCDAYEIDPPNKKDTPPAQQTKGGQLCGDQGSPPAQKQGSDAPHGWPEDFENFA